MKTEESQCSRCLKPSEMMCRRCFQVYCSTKCQTLDWSTHKTVCIEMPSLAPLSLLQEDSVRTSVQSRLNVEKLPLYNVESKKECDTNHDQSFRTRTISQQLQSPSQSQSFGNGKPKTANRDEVSQVTTPKKPMRNEFEIEAKDKKPTDVSANSHDASNGPLFIKPIVDELNNWRSHIVPPMRDWIEVLVQYRDNADPTILWVVEKRHGNDMKKLCRQMYQLMTHDNKFSDEDTTAGKLVVVDFAQMPYRAELLKINYDNQQVRLRFIDIGGIETLAMSLLYTPNSVVLSTKAFAFRIRTNRIWEAQEMDQVIKIRIISGITPSGYYMAEVENNFKIAPKDDYPIQTEALEPHGADGSQAGVTALPPSPPQSPVDTIIAGAAMQPKNNVNLDNPKNNMNLDKPKNNVNVDKDAEKRPVHLAMPQLSVSSANGKKLNESVKMFTIEDVEVVPLSTGANIPLIVLDKSRLSSDGYLCVCDASNKQLISHQANLEKVVQYCEKAAKTNANGYAPKKGEVCLAIYDADHQWYRALCLQKFDDDFYQIQFVDYGNKSMVKSSNIMAIPKDLMFPTFANYCYIEESLQGQLIKANTFKAAIEERDNRFYILDILY